MKRLVSLALIPVMLCGLVSFAFADNRHYRDDRRGHEQRQERQYDRHDNDGPPRWGEHRRPFDGRHMRAIHDRQLEHRYPGLRGYRWHGDGDRGFWHNGRYVHDGIVFFDRDDRMAGFGYMANGVFIFVNEGGYHEDHGDLLFLLLLMKILESQD